ncbi:MAG: hypothetical protein GY755_10095 [Chloroflexi bacterium]|nr:hypothetical protein [Chloroflexota bacterium]
MKLSLPNYNELCSVALEVIPFDEKSKVGILDLGTETGLFSEHVFSYYKRRMQRLTNTIKTRWSTY